MTSEALELPVPLPPEVGGTRDTFLDLSTFIAFFTTAISVILLTFRYINYLMTEAALEAYRYEEDYASPSIRWYPGGGRSWSRDAGRAGLYAFARGVRRSGKFRRQEGSLSKNGRP
jgi:hypothetical protein